MSERPDWVYRPNTNYEAVDRRLQDLTGRRITYKDLFEVIADVFAARTGEEWKKADEVWLQARDKRMCVGYIDVTMWSAPIRYSESWVGLHPLEIGSMYFNFRDWGKGRVRVYQPDFDKEIEWRPGRLTQLQRRELVLDLSHGLKSPSPEESQP